MDAAPRARCARGKGQLRYRLKFMILRTRDSEPAGHADGVAGSCRRRLRLADLLASTGSCPVVRGGPSERGQVSRLQKETRVAIDVANSFAEMPDQPNPAAIITGALPVLAGINWRRRPRAGEVFARFSRAPPAEVYVPLGRCASVALSCCVEPPCSTVTLTVSPGLCCMMTAARSSALVTALPSIASITSPPVTYV